MRTAYLDTHVAVWLHDGLVHKLTGAAKVEIEAGELRISPMVYLEFHYLFQRNRVRYDAPVIYANLNGTFGVALCQLPFAAVGVASLQVDWTPDPFDRLIVANAWANRKASLISADELIRKNYSNAVW